jgi:hypothetical protein
LRCGGKLLKQGAGRIAFVKTRPTPAARQPGNHTNSKGTTMRKLTLSICAIAIACAAMFVWSNNVVAPLQAAPGQSISPTDMMMTYTAPLPVEQWDAI